MRERVKRREGVVVSAKMSKTVVVEIDHLLEHPTYGKRMRRQQRIMAHDESGQCGEGDKVSIVETHPLSRLKRWRVSQVLAKAAGSA